MKVFTEDWINQLQNRYRNHARYEKPLIYHYATDPKFDTLRHEIEEWIGHLPKATLSKVTPRLRNEDHFHQTYNELCVGQCLRQLGYTIEYEKPFQIGDMEVTPDWYATSRAELAVEVFTCNPSHTSDQERERLGYLYARLSEIPSRAIVGISHGDICFFSQSESKKIVEAVIKWLNTHDLDEKEPLRLDNIAFEFLGTHEGKFLQWFGSVNVFCVNSSVELKPKIELKVRKYKSLGIPLVIAVIPNFHTFLDLEDVKNVLWGQEVWMIDESVTSRQKDGLYTSPAPIDPALSAVIWMPKRLGIPLPMPYVSVFPNPTAEIQLSEQDFKSKDNAKKII